MKSKIAMFIVMLSLFSLSCSNGNRPVLDLENFGIESNQEIYQSIKQLFQQGKRSIPDLIEKISDRENVKPYTLHQRSSSVFHVEGVYRCYGFLYAYIIEMIIGEKTFAEVEDLRYYPILGSDANYMYQAGVIMDKFGNVATEQDLVEIQRIYKAWWKKNKNKSLERLRKEWWNDLKPLANSPFHWE